MTASLPEFETYSDMFRDYLGEADWITSSELPLVHHIRKLCQQLDNAGMDKAAMSSAYLQAVERLERRRPRPSGGGAAGPGDDPDQTTIFDHID